MSETPVLYETRDAVAYVTFNRPHVLNAGNHHFAEAFRAAVTRIRESPEIRVAVFTGAGRAFSTGVDLDAMATGDLRYEDLIVWEDGMTDIERLECLTIAGINGHCVGGGLQMALVCDYRLASDAARLGLPAVRECLIPSMAPYRLPRIVGLGRAKELILTGELITATQAEAIGLVSRTVPAAEFPTSLAETVERFRSLPFSSTRACKRLTTRAFELDFETFRAEMEAAQRLCMAAPEHRAAVNEYHARTRRQAAPDSAAEGERATERT